MEPHHLDRLGQLLQKARHLGPDDAEKFISAVDDEWLATELRSLLPNVDRADTWMQSIRQQGVLLALKEITGGNAASTLPPRAGRYKIEERIGSGGTGTVYRAVDTRLQRPVAIKVLSHSLCSLPSVQRQFIKEAHTGSALDHPNICTVHDIGQLRSGRLFIVMTYYDGETLSQRLKKSVLRVQEAILIAIGMARGLAAAHRSGVVHRDVKPGNVMLTTSGQIKLLDFGLATASAVEEGGDGLCRSGTPAYMSPEHLRGEQVDNRTDLWALGVVLYEMLAGQPPFGRSFWGRHVCAMIAEDPVPIQELPSAVSQPLAAIVSHLLCRDVSRRYQQADQVAADLLCLLERGGGARSPATIDVMFDGALMHQPD